MKKKLILLFFVPLFFCSAFWVGCQREIANTPLTGNCRIVKLISDSIETTQISYDNQGRMIRVHFVQNPEASFNITYTADQKITQTDSSGGNYEKRVFTYDTGNRLLNVKTYYTTGDSVIAKESILTWNGNEIATDTFRVPGSADLISNYTWQNGNVIKTVNNLGTMIYQYDSNRPWQAGDIIWELTEIENDQFQVTTTNLVVGQVFVDNNGDSTIAIPQYFFDSGGKIVKASILSGTGGFENIYECN